MNKLFWTMFCVAIVSGWAGVSQQASAQQEKAPEVSQPVTPAGEPVLEEPTLHCLGAYWIIPGDEEKRFRVDMAYRKIGDAEWTKSLPMMRVRKGDTMQKTHEAELNPPADAWLFAGSVVNLTPGTDYELKLTPVKSEGAPLEKVLKTRTASEPTDPAEMRTVHVVPGAGGGDGTEAAPYQGLAYAQSESRPGTLFLVHKGTYAAPFVVNRGGTKEQPIIWRGVGDGEATIDGGGTAKFGIEAALVDHVRFEELTIKGAYLGVMLRGCSDLAIRRCHIRDVKCGIYGYSEGERILRRIFIADNLMEGPFTWGKGILGAGADELRGIQITGIGHEICYNRIVNFKDGVDTFPSKYCSAIDIHHNDLVNCKDDGIEMDFSERNTRCFENRLTNVHQGVSEQPVYGGPVYIFRNVLYNVGVEPFKLHHNGGPRSHIDWWPSGIYVFHNTIVKKGEPCILWSSGEVYNVTYRNNLFIGGGKRAMHFDPPMIDCDFDYDAFGGGPWDIFMKWQGVFYKTFDEVKGKDAPIQQHAVLVDADTVFASGVKRPDNTETSYDPAKTDLRPAKESAVVDAGMVLPGFNDGYAGKAPDIGAYEAGRGLPFYGPRKE